VALVQSRVRTCLQQELVVVLCGKLVMWCVLKAFSEAVRAWKFRLIAAVQLIS